MPPAPVPGDRGGMPEQSSAVANVHRRPVQRAASQNVRIPMYWTQGLHRTLQQDPDAPATIYRQRQRTVREQADRVARLAGGLRELGISAGASVGVLALNSDRFAELLLAVPWADGSLTPF